jgi:hypothetical protein
MSEQTEPTFDPRTDGRPYKRLYIYLKSGQTIEFPNLERGVVNEILDCFEEQGSGFHLPAGRGTVLSHKTLNTDIFLGRYYIPTAYITAVFAPQD